MTHAITVAAIQMTSGADPQANLAAADPLVEAAAQAGARLVELPENALFMGRRERDKLTIAEPHGKGPLQTGLAELARRHGVYLVCGSFPLQLAGRDDKVAQSTLVYAPDGSERARYDKQHLFDVVLESGKSFQESRYFIAGDQPPQCFDCDGVSVGPSICYDLRFPELYRDLQRQSADILLVPAAFTYPTGQAHWEVLLRARAVENLAAVVAAGQCGTHPNGQHTWGHSMIIDHWGRVLAEADETPGLITATIDLAAQARRRQEFPVLQHRRDQDKVQE